jgi:parallel beta-helix repeat protein
MRFAAAALVGMVVFAGAADARTWRVAPGPTAQEDLQTALLDAHPGDTVQLAPGRFEITQGLSLDVDRVTLRGAGQDRSILSFARQTRGAEGLLVTSNGVTFQDFAVENTRGDAIKARDCQDITFRAVRAEWTGGPSAHNGAYGLYPVNCSDVLIERSIARGASDAGIYVGQSRNIIVRDSTAEGNVAGIEIENSYDADVFNNVSAHNTGGILVFDLPDLQQKGGHSVRVFHNHIQSNNTVNFAAPGAIVGNVPAGTGVLIMANRQVVVFDNDIGDNGTANVIVTAYRNEFQDPNYDPLPRDIVIRNNRFGRSGFAPAGDMAGLAQAGVRLPDVIWDGANTYASRGTPHTEAVHVVMKDNHGAAGGLGTFLSMGITAAGAPLDEGSPDPHFPSLYQIEEPRPVHLR